jgi:hypothetical protein
MSDQRSVFISRYKSLLSDFTSAMGGESANATRRALGSTLASLQAQLLGLNDKFANGSGSPDEVSQFLKISGAIVDLLTAAGLSQALQTERIPSAHELDDARDDIRAAYLRVLATRQQDAGRATVAASATGDATPEAVAEAATVAPPAATAIGA